MELKQWFACLKKGNTPHGVLLAGPEGSGKKDYARQAAALYLKGTAEPEALTDCPYFREMEDTSIETLRDCCAELNQQAFGRGRRCLLLPDAHLLDMRTQNTLLKTLEEPPEEALLVLTGNEEGLLPPIRSRCMIVRVGAMPMEQVAEILKRQGVSPERAALAASLSGGYPGTAARYAQDDYMEFRREALLLLEEALFGPSPFAKAAGLIQTEENKKKKLSPQRARDLTDILGTLLRDSLPQAAGAPMNTDCQKLRNKIAARFTRGQIQGMINRTLWAQKQLALKAGPGSVTDLLLLELKL